MFVLVIIDKTCDLAFILFNLTFDSVEFFPRISIKFYVHSLLHTHLVQVFKFPLFLVDLYFFEEVRIFLHENTTFTVLCRILSFHEFRLNECVFNVVL